MSRNRHTIEDINHLVAFAQTFQDISVHRPPEHKKTPYVIPSGSEEVPDALASILADGTPGEVYAIGAHVDPDRLTDPATVVVASNYEITDSLEDYMRSIWRRLRKIARIRQQNKRARNNDDIQELSRQRRNLVRKIYFHCFDKFKKRVVREYNSMMELANSDELNDFLKKVTQSEKFGIHFLFLIVEEIGMKLEQFDVLEFLDEDDLLINRMEKFYRGVQEHRKILQKLDEMCVELKCFPGPLIEKYMDKVAALHGSIRVIYASTRLSSICRTLERRLVVKRLTSESVSVQPPSSNTYHRLFGRIFGVVDSWHGYHEIRAAVKYVVRTVEERHHSETNKPLLIHPECMILEYFSTQPFTSPPLRYIGASKIPCIACQSLLRAWNHISPYKTYICRGSEGKLYRWGIPRGLRARRRCSSKGPVHEIYRRIFVLISRRLDTISCPVCLTRRAARAQNVAEGIGSSTLGRSEADSEECMIDVYRSRGHLLSYSA